MQFRGFLLGHTHTSNGSFWPISASRHQQRWVDSCLLPPDQKQSLGCGYKIRGDSRRQRPPNNTRLISFFEIV